MLLFKRAWVVLRNLYFQKQLVYLLFCFVLLFTLLPKLFYLFFPQIIFISWKLITLQYCSVFCHTLTWISHRFSCVPHPELPSLLTPHPIPLGLASAPARALVSYIQPGPVICFTLDNIHVSMLFSQIISPSPSPIQSKSLFYTSVSLFLSCIQGYRYYLSKFHIYVLVYCIGVFLSGLLHSV